MSDNIHYIGKNNNWIKHAPLEELEDEFDCAQEWFKEYIAKLYKAIEKKSG